MERGIFLKTVETQQAVWHAAMPPTVGTLPLCFRFGIATAAIGPHFVSTLQAAPIILKRSALETSNTDPVVYGLPPSLLIVRRTAETELTPWYSRVCFAPCTPRATI
jgi:hypothetical protein